MKDHVEELEQHLKHIDVSLSVAEPRELAGLLRERRITLNEIAALGGIEEGSRIDELARRREDRRSKADVGKVSKSRSK